MNRNFNKQDEKSNLERAVAVGTLYILTLAVIVLLFCSCSSSKAVYDMGNDSWKTLPKKSQLTGWDYKK